MLGFCTSPHFVDHDTGPNHPERPDRIRAIFAAVRQAGLVASANPFADFQIDLGLSPSPGTRPVVELVPSPADEKWLTTVHTARHIQWVKTVCSVGSGVVDQGDTPVSAQSYETALLSLGAALRCADAVMAGEVRRAFAAVRPPGHHAEPNRAMGFCLFANVAITARYLQERHGLHRVAIVDFDVHHGNGTQACLEDDPSVLFISLHENPRTCYPGSGYEWETGTGVGEGYTLNIPFDPGAENEEYLAALRERVIPKLDEFRPEFLLISAGFDAHRDDPLANINLNDAAFGLMTEQLVAAAERLCGGRIVSVLEGGYNLRALGRSVVRHMLALG